MKLRNKLFTAALILFFLFSQSFLAQNYWTIDQITNTDATENITDIEVGPDGVIHMVYELSTRSRVGKNIVYEDDVYYIKKTTAGWGIPISLSLPGYDENRPRVDVDESGLAHVVFTRHLRDDANTLSGSIYYWNSDKEPTELVLIDKFPDYNPPIAFPGGADIAVSGIDKKIHIALSATHICCLDGSDRSNIYYTTSSDGVYFNDIVNLETNLDTPLDDRGSISPSIDIDESGKVGILFTTYWIHDGGDNTFSISYTYNSGNSFPIPNIVIGGGSGEVQLQDYPPFKLSGGIPYIVFNRVNDLYNCACPGRNDLLFAKLDALGNLNSPPTVVAQGIGDSYNGTSIDFQGEAEENPDILHVAYVGYYNAGSVKKENWKAEVRYIQLDASTGEKLPYESISDGSGPSIAVNSNGVANISFTNGGDVFYATNDVPPPPPDGGVMHVSDIDMTTEDSRGRWNAVAKVFVVDADNSAQVVSGAFVTGNWSGLVSGTSSATTDAYGTATFKSGKTKKSGSITFTVTSVSKVGWSYDGQTPSGSISSPLGKKTADYIESVTPDTYALFDNYPNPFNPSTIIKYSIPEEAYVSLKVFDVLGKEITSLVSKYQHPGYYEIDFNASNLSNDVYFYILKAGSFVETKKMILMK